MTNRNSNRNDPDNNWSRPSPQDAPAPSDNDALSTKQRLMHALTDAWSEAHMAAQTTERGGTCNFDAPMLDLEDVDDDTRDAALDAANERLPDHVTLRFYEREYGIHEGYTKLGGLPGGQGRTRTKAAEAATETLRTYDFDAMTEHRMD